MLLFAVNLVSNWVLILYRVAFCATVWTHGTACFVYYWYVYKLLLVCSRPLTVRQSLADVFLYLSTEHDGKLMLLTYLCPKKTFDFFASKFLGSYNLKLSIHFNFFHVNFRIPTTFASILYKVLIFLTPETVHGGKLIGKLKNVVYFFNYFWF